MARITRARQLPQDASFDVHVTSRCSRELHLLGDGAGEPDGLRKELLLAQLELLVGQMAVKVLAFAVMDNHVHLVLRRRVEEAAGWSAAEVVRRWLVLHPLRNGYNQPRGAEEDELSELAADSAWVEATRAKLVSVSQFMKDFKQHATLQLNRLEDTSGPAWQGRFKSVAITDVEQLVATLVYVDLNPFAAGVCELPEDGRHTSLEGRLGRDKPKEEEAPESETISTASTAANSADRARSNAREPDGPRIPKRRPSGTWLSPMDETAEAQRRRGGRPLADGAAVAAEREGCVTAGLSMRVYLTLLDAVAKRFREGKKRLHASTRGVLERIGLNADAVAGRVWAMAAANPPASIVGHRCRDANWPIGSDGEI